MVLLLLLLDPHPWTPALIYAGFQNHVLYLIDTYAHRLGRSRCPSSTSSYDDTTLRIAPITVSMPFVCC